MIYLILILIALSISIWLLLKHRKKGNKVSGYGIETYDNYGNITFSTGDRLFRYVGYRDVNLGNFDIYVNAPNGQAVFIPIIISSNNPELSHRTAIAVDIPYISGGVINGNRFTGVVKSPADFRYTPELKNRPLIRISYGVY